MRRVINELTATEKQHNTSLHDVTFCLLTFQRPRTQDDAKRWESQINAVLINLDMQPKEH